MLTLKEEALRKQLEQRTGSRPIAPAHFDAFDDLEENVRVQVERIKSHPWVPQHISGARLPLRREDGTIARSGRGSSAKSRIADSRCGIEAGPSTLRASSIPQSAAKGKAVLRRSGKSFSRGLAHSRLVVLRIHNHVTAQAFAFALGAQVTLVAQSQVDDTALAR